MIRYSDFENIALKNTLDSKVDKASLPVIIDDVSKLPAPDVNGARVLANNTTYYIKGSINIGNTYLVLGVSNTLYGEDKSDDRIIYTGTGAMIRGVDRTVTINTINAVAPNGSIFDIVNSASFSFQARECIFAGLSMGRVLGSQLFAFNNNIVGNIGDFEISGTFQDIGIAYNYFLGTSNLTRHLHINSVTANTIKIAVNSFNVIAGKTGINISNVAILNQGAGSIIGNTFYGLGKYINGVAEDTRDWELESNGYEVIPTSAGYSPNNISVLKDDFITGSTETGEIGDLSWSFSNGSISNPTIPSEVGHTGFIRRRTSTVVNQLCPFHLGTGTANPNIAYQNFRSLIFIFRPLGTLTNYGFRFGIANDWNSLTPTHGVYLQKLNTDTNFQFISRNNGLQTQQDSLVAVVTNTWNKLEIVKLDNGVQFKLNGVNVGDPIITNIPDNNDFVHAGMFNFTVSGSQDVDIDWFSMIITTPDR